MKTLLTIIVMSLSGCAHVAMVAATTTSGHTYEYCLEATQIYGTDTLFCGSLTQVEAQKQEQQKLHPADTLTIVKTVPAK